MKLNCKELQEYWIAGLITKPFARVIVVMCFTCTNGSAVRVLRGGFKSYTVFVLDSNFNVVMKSEPLKETSWAAPQSLKRGAVYAWQVTAHQNGKVVTAPAAPLPEARFKIVEQAKIEELQRLATERPDSHLILAVIYAREGLLDEAERELQTAINQNQDADTAKKLLQSVKSMRQ